MSPPLSLGKASHIKDLTLDDLDAPTSLPTADDSLEPPMPDHINNFNQDEHASQLAEKQPGGQKSRNRSIAGSIPHNLSPKVRGVNVSRVLELEDERIEQSGSRSDDLDL